MPNIVPIRRSISEQRPSRLDGSFLFPRFFLDSILGPPGPRSAALPPLHLDRWNKDSTFLYMNSVLSSICLSPLLQTGYHLLMSRQQRLRHQGPAAAEIIQDCPPAAALSDPSCSHSNLTTTRFHFIPLYLIGCTVRVLVVSSVYKQS